MGNTVTPLQGYLAGIFRSPGMTVGGSTVHELVRNGDFETGDFTNWTNNTTGSRATVVASSGYNEMSYGAVLVDDGPTGNTVQITGSRTLDTPFNPTDAAEYDVVLSCWAKHSVAGNTGSLKLVLRDPTGSILTSGSVALVDHGFYPEADWGYYSVRIDAVDRLETIEWQVSTDMASGSTGTMYVDNVSCAVVQQIAGAYGALTKEGDEWETEDVTTFASVGVDGPFRRWAPTMRSQGKIHVDSFYVTSEQPATPMAQQDKVFVVLATKKGTKTQDRWEFWARPMGVEFRAPIGEVQKEPFDLIIDGIVGYADR